MKTENPTIFSAKLGNTRIALVRGSLVDERTQVIVNEANNALILGAGLGGAIRRAGGP